MSKDFAKGNEGVVMGMATEQKEKGFWNDRWVFHKYASEEDYRNNNPFEVNTVEKGNVLLNVGINRIWDLVTGDSALTFTEAETEIGVGDDDTAASAGQTDLEASENAEYKGMEDGYPQSGSDQKIVARSVFGADDGNYDWREFVIKRGVCLNRLVSNQGTKAQDQVWTVTLEITLS